MHEQSETQSLTAEVPFDEDPRGLFTRWENVYGPGVINTPGVTARPGMPLPPYFPYEQQFYPSEQMAVNAAQRRSSDFGQLIDSLNQRKAMLDQLMGKQPEPFQTP